MNYRVTLAMREDVSHKFFLVPPFCFLFRLELKHFHNANQTRSKVNEYAFKQLKKRGNASGHALDDEPGKAICQRARSEFQAMHCVQDFSLTLVLRGKQC